MKRFAQDSGLFEIVNLFDEIGKSHNYKLGDADSEKVFVDTVLKALSANTKNPMHLHGRRIELMFGFVAASLGNCSVVKREDIGDLYAVDSDLRRPDYHIILKDGYQFFVEVKNRYKGSPLDQYKFTSSYIQSLEKYAQLFKLDLKIALYWPKVKAWTMVSANRLRGTPGGFSINFVEAIVMNEMSLLGDRLLGTIPPLTSRVLTDPEKPRKVDDSGQVGFTIGDVEFYSKNVKIEDAFEKRIAFYLMLYGNWLISEPKAEIEAGELLSISFEFMPVETTPNQKFETIGYLSGMISNRYNHLTAPNRNIERLSPNIEPDVLDFFISQDYEGKYLPIWRFLVKPKYDLASVMKASEGL